MSPHVSYQSDTESVWRAILNEKGDLAFDIGANGGLVASALSGKFEHVVAVEPAIESYEQLEKMAPPNVTPLNLAVSSTKGRITLRETALTERLGELFTGESLPWGEHRGYREVEAVTLDDLSQTYGYPDFMKIDTEGHELQIFQAAAATLLARPRFVIEIHSRYNGERIKQRLNEADMPYQVHLHAGYRATSPHREQHYWLASP